VPLRLPLVVAAAVAVATLAACGDDGDAAPACEPNASLTVGANDSLEFDAESYEVEAGCVDVTYRNDGNIAHTLVIDDVDDFKLEVGDVDRGTVGLEAGTYRMFCDLPAHEAAGMESQLTVG
jgi:plastocyanin